MLSKHVNTIRDVYVDSCDLIGIAVGRGEEKGLVDAGGMMCKWVAGARNWLLNLDITTITLSNPTKNGATALQ